jgi:hypothetical protein
LQRCKSCGVLKVPSPSWLQQATDIKESNALSPSSPSSAIALPKSSSEWYSVNFCSEVPSLRPLPYPLIAIVALSFLIFTTPPPLRLSFPPPSLSPPPSPPLPSGVPLSIHSLSRLVHWLEHWHQHGVQSGAQSSTGPPNADAHILTKP